MSLFFNVAEASSLTVTGLVTNINRFIINPLILSIFAISLLLFIWGIIRFLAQRQQGQSGDDGKRHMFWGVVGMFIMASVFGIMQLLANTIVKGNNIAGNTFNQVQKK